MMLAAMRAAPKAKPAKSKEAKKNAKKNRFGRQVAGRFGGNNLPGMDSNPISGFGI